MEKQKKTKAISSTIEKTVEFQKTNWLALVVVMFVGLVVYSFVVGQINLMAEEALVISLF